MRRGLTLAMLALSMVLGVALYRVSYSTQSLEHEFARVNRQIAAAKEAEHLLAAEWSYLNAPARIEALARRHLGFAPLLGEQMVALADLPMARPADATAIAEGAIRPKPKPAALRLVTVAAAQVSAQLAATSEARAPAAPDQGESLSAKMAAVLEELTR